MRFFPKLLALTAVLSYSLGSGIHPLAAQAQPTVSALFQQLQSNQTSSQAEAQLLQLGNSDVGAKRYLARHLPALIGKGPKGSPQVPYPQQLWLDEVRLAGELRMVEAAPALAKWISVRTGGGLITQFREESLQDSPAGTALVQIGDPAIPTLQDLLAHGNRDERVEAARALDDIGSPKATATLRQYAATGQDRDLADFIKRVMLR